MRRDVVIPGLLLLTLVSGCLSEIRDEMTEFRIGWGNKFAARAAWKNAQGACQGIGCPHSFREGFTSGYIAVANGATGCPPAVPIISCHNHMWMDRCSENDKMAAWYDGYEVGVMAAKADGMVDANRMTTRIPQPTPVDYSGASQINATGGTAGASVDPAIPPSPIAEPTELGGSQTSRLLQEALQ